MFSLVNNWDWQGVHGCFVYDSRIMGILKMCQVGRNYFLPGGSVPIPQHRFVFRSFFIRYLFKIQVDAREWSVRVPTVSINRTFERFVERIYFMFFGNDSISVLLLPTLTMTNIFYVLW